MCSQGVKLSDLQSLGTSSQPSRSVTDLDSTTWSQPPCLLKRSYLTVGIQSRRRVRGRGAGSLHHTQPWNSGVHFSAQLFDMWTHRKYQCWCGPWCIWPASSEFRHAYTLSPACRLHIIKQARHPIGTGHLFTEDQGTYYCSRRLSNETLVIEVVPIGQNAPSLFLASPNNELVSSKYISPGKWSLLDRCQTEMMRRKPAPLQWSLSPIGTSKSWQS